MRGRTARRSAAAASPPGASGSRALPDALNAARAAADGAERRTGMRQDDRAAFDRALTRARVAAYAPGEFVGQESFMTAGEIRALAAQAGVGPGVEVLDLCCGVAGPGRFIT